MDNLSEEWNFEELQKSLDKSKPAKPKYDPKQAQQRAWIPVYRMDALKKTIKEDPQFGVCLMPLPKGEYAAPWFKMTLHFGPLKRYKVEDSAVSKLFYRADGSRAFPPCLSTLKSFFPKAQVPAHLGDLCPLCEIDQSPFTLYYLLGSKFNWIKTSEDSSKSVQFVGGPIMVSLTWAELHPIFTSGKLVSRSGPSTPVVIFSKNVGFSLPDTVEYADLLMTSVRESSKTHQRFYAENGTDKFENLAVFANSVLHKDFRELLTQAKFYQEIARFYSSILRVAESKNIEEAISQPVPNEGDF